MPDTKPELAFKGNKRADCLLSTFLDMTGSENDFDKNLSSLLMAGYKKNHITGRRR